MHTEKEKKSLVSVKKLAVVYYLVIVFFDLIAFITDYFFDTVHVFHDWGFILSTTLFIMILGFIFALMSFSRNPLYKNWILVQIFVFFFCFLLGSYAWINSGYVQAVSFGLASLMPIFLIFSNAIVREKRNDQENKKYFTR
ncbi:MAG: hypothetical protein GXP45_04235 [bacterium]|nr:hypothetical protein [bacterium]